MLIAFFGMLLLEKGWEGTISCPKSKLLSSKSDLSTRKQLKSLKLEALSKSRQKNVKTIACVQIVAVQSKNGSKSPNSDGTICNRETSV